MFYRKSVGLTSGLRFTRPMRQPRLEAPPDLPVAYYHCVSRVVDRQFVLGDAE